MFLMFFDVGELFLNLNNGILQKDHESNNLTSLIMVKHSSAVFKHISNFDLISACFLNIQTIMKTKGKGLPNCEMSNFFQVPVLFIHPCVCPHPEDVSLLRKVEGIMAL